MMEPTLTNMAPRQNDVQADELAMVAPFFYLALPRF